MDTNAKIKLVAQLLQALGLAGSNADKRHTIKELMKELGIEDSLKVDSEKLTVPDGFRIENLSKLRCAKLGSNTIGVVFTLRGKNFIFSIKDQYTNVSPADIEQQINNLPTIGEQKWRIPTVEEFEVVQKHLYEFNQLIRTLRDGKSLERQEYMDNQTPKSKKVPHVRLVLPAPWLD